MSGLWYVRPAPILTGPCGTTLTCSPETDCIRQRLHVDDRRFARDGDGLLERADPQVGVHGRGERTGQLDALTLDR